MMMYSIILLSLFSTCLASCGDNCVRAVLNSRNTEAATTDCITFMRDTVTPATATSTFTYTPTVYSVVGGGSKHKRAPALPGRRDKAPLGPRQVTVDPTSIPTYATAACTAPSAFSNACSCIGVTATTLTAPTPLHTVTASVTVTSTVCDPANNYGLEYDYVNSFGHGQVAAYYEITQSDCCALCYTEGTPCLWYAYEAYTGTTGECGVVTEYGPPSPEVGPAVPSCPWGIYSITTVLVVDPTPTAYGGGSTGLGPCVTYIP